jgi:hypothetical protein
MPKGKKSDKKSKRKKRSFGDKITWVLNNLSVTHLDTLDERYPNADQIMDFFLACIDSGLNVTVSWDDYSGGYQATAIGNWEGFANSGYGVSGRSSRDCHDALAIIWYKIAICAEGDLSSMPSDREEEDMRG